MRTCKDCIHFSLCEYNNAIGAIAFTDADKCAEYEDKYRFLEIPVDAEDAGEFYRAMKSPDCCNEDHCENCAFDREDGCVFKPYVSKISAERYWKAVCIVSNAETSREAAEAALKERDGK